LYELVKKNLINKYDSKNAKLYVGIASDNVKKVVEEIFRRINRG
jgi:hypothetical protein